MKSFWPLVCTLGLGAHLAAQPISLAFPVPMAPTCPKGQCNPYTAPIAAVFDHLTSGSYAIDGTIQAYTGDLASNTYGPGNPKGFKAVASDSQVVLSWPATVGASSYSLAFSTARSLPAQTKAVCAAGIELGAATTYIHTGGADRFGLCRKAPRCAEGQRIGASADCRRPRQNDLAIGGDGFEALRIPWAVGIAGQIAGIGLDGSVYGI